jgi:RsmE family RNA methyltransferase
MNIVLFDLDEAGRPLPRSDRRAVHVLDVLRRLPGDGFDAGLIDGPRGKATVVAIGDDAIELSFAWGELPPPCDPMTLIAGLPRPQTARRVLQDATTLGVSAIHFVATERGDPNYRRSQLWSSGEWRRHLIAGAAQAFTTRLPAVTWTQDLAGALSVTEAGGSRVALDNYEGTARLSSLDLTTPVTIAVGPERGWSAAERDLLRDRGFALADLGERVLRTETACVAALTLVRAGLGLT